MNTEIEKSLNTLFRLSVYMEATPGFEPGVKDLQSSALPLGHVALLKEPIVNTKTGSAKSRWSGQRDSNPRPQPWQGCALPTEPCPREKIY